MCPRGILKKGGYVHSKYI